MRHATTDAQHATIFHKTTILNGLSVRPSERTPRMLIDHSMPHTVVSP